MLKAHSAVQSMRSGRTRGRVHITPKTAEKNFLKLFTSSSYMRGWYLFSGVVVTVVRSNGLRAPQHLNACDWVSRFTIDSTA